MAGTDHQIGRLKSASDPPLADWRGRAILPPPKEAARDPIGRSVLKHYAADTGSVGFRLGCLADVSAAVNSDATLWALQVLRLYRDDAAVAQQACGVLARILVPTEQDFGEIAAALQAAVRRRQSLAGGGKWGLAREAVTREAEQEMRSGQIHMAAAAMRVARGLRAQAAGAVRARAELLFDHGVVPLLRGVLLTHRDDSGVVQGALSTALGLCADPRCVGAFTQDPPLAAEVAAALQRFSQHAEAVTASCGALAALAKGGPEACAAVVAAGGPAAVGAVLCAPPPPADAADAEMCSVAGDPVSVSAVRGACRAAAALCAGGGAPTRPFLEAGGLRVLVRSARRVLRDAPAQLASAECLAAVSAQGHGQALAKVWAVRHVVAGLTALVAAHEPDDSAAARGIGAEDPDHVLGFLAPLEQLGARWAGARLSLAAVGLGVLFRVFRRHSLNAEVLGMVNACILLVLQEPTAVELCLQQGHHAAVVGALGQCEESPQLLAQLVDIVTALAGLPALRDCLANAGAAHLALRAMQLHTADAALCTRVARCLAVFAAVPSLRRTIAEGALPLAVEAMRACPDDSALRTGCVVLFTRYANSADRATEEDRAILLEVGAPAVAARAARAALDAHDHEELCAAMQLLGLLASGAACAMDGKAAVADTGALELCADVQRMLCESGEAKGRDARQRRDRLDYLARALVASLAVIDLVEERVAALPSDLLWSPDDGDSLARRRSTSHTYLDAQPTTSRPLPGPAALQQRHDTLT